MPTLSPEDQTRLKRALVVALFVIGFMIVIAALGWGMTSPDALGFIFRGIALGFAFILAGLILGRSFGERFKGVGTPIVLSFVLYVSFALLFASNTTLESVFEGIGVEFFGAALTFFMFDVIRRFLADKRSNVDINKLRSKWKREIGAIPSQHADKSDEYRAGYTDALKAVLRDTNE
jgi:hypothetical protein